MELKSYFAKAAGLGILSTADGDGKVDAAVYSRPHVLEDGTVAFIMRDRLTHHNLRCNPHAAYLFKEDGPGYEGKRLFLTKISEEKESRQLYELRRKSYPEDQERREVKYLVFFRVDQALPLIGPGHGNA
jgi:Pyridoxamine 5'-phosphate oxidase